MAQNPETLGQPTRAKVVEAMYYISKVSLRNIRCLPEEVTFTVPAPSNGSPSWTLVLGDNGTGKTSILRCIAISLCDETAAADLLAELPGSMIRAGQDYAEIELALTSTPPNATSRTILTTLRKKNSGGESLKQTVKPECVDLHDKIFACGYGSSYGTIGNESYETYRLIDAVYSLFNYDTRLQNPETALFEICERMQRQSLHSYSALRRELFDQICAILMLESGSLSLDSRGLGIRDFCGGFIPMRTMGDCNAATLTWVCDLLYWTLLAQKESDRPQPKGIVLFDEIENHLHPNQQREIIHHISHVFPQIQFIATTNAPLIATGSATLPVACCRLIRLIKTGHGVEVNPDLQPPEGLRADQVLTLELFGLLSTTSIDTVEKIERYVILSSKPALTESERNEAHDLQTDLNRTFGTPETPLQCKVEEAITKAFRDLADVSEFDQSAVTFEIRRQLEERFR